MPQQQGYELGSPLERIRNVTVTASGNKVYSDTVLGPSSDVVGITNIQANDSPSIDSFGRWRVSNPETLFDSKQIFDNQPLFWDDQEETGTGATISGGTHIDGGYFSTTLPITNTVPNALRLGANIAGSTDTIVLAVQPITNNIGVQTSLTWREAS